MHFPLLLCPAEIREQVYRELLSSACSRRVREGRPRYKFQLNILRANRQIFQEAKKILEDNVFIKITTPWLEAIQHISSEGKVVVVATGDNAERYINQHLWVYIDAPEMPRLSRATYSMLMCLEDLEVFTAGWHINNLDNPELNRHLSLRLTVQDPYDHDRKLPKSLQQRLLLPFGVIKNLSEFSIQGSKVLPSVKEALVKAQAIPDPTREECLERATTLQEAGIKAIEAGDYRQALHTFFDAFAAMHIQIEGRKRTILAETFYIEVIQTGIYKGERGDYVRMGLRVSLVANVILAYLKLEEWVEAHFWGKRSLVLFRQSVTGDTTEELDFERSSFWIIGTANMQVPAKADMGYIFYRTALASRAMGNEADVKTLIKVAALYLPNDPVVQADCKALEGR